MLDGVENVARTSAAGMLDGVENVTPTQAIGMPDGVENVTRTFSEKAFPSPEKATDFCTAGKTPVFLRDTRIFPNGGGVMITWWRQG